MEQVLSSLRDEKVSLGVLGAVFVLLFYAYAWANDEYAKQSDFDELKELIINHTEEFRINNASQIIRDLKTDIRIAEATRDPDAPDVELKRLREQLEHAEDYKRCLVERRPNCKHLKDVE